ncbi:hypothetical protein [Thermospira aquatica]|uniref:Uncharacterized protein n=1 Tax=Thermospira aquatica TaxID=2828656 RepID=A0AAX3BB46_9SPIR|nr:hypothetical protein [Thermospira aquatica]URA09538.1 hypothetical protein KDW03_08570 [Thermospira aquatica]
MNFSEIELFEIARLIKEEEKQIFTKLTIHNNLAEKTQKFLEETLVFYAREEKQKKRKQKICQYIDNEETLAYLKEKVADIFAISQKIQGLSLQDVQQTWINTHQKVLQFFETLANETNDQALKEDIQSILSREREWHTHLSQPDLF